WHTGPLSHGFGSCGLGCYSPIAAASAGHPCRSTTPASRKPEPRRHQSLPSVAFPSRSSPSYWSSQPPPSPFPSRSPPLLPSPVAAAIIADGCSAATPNGGRRQTPNAAVPPSSVVRHRRLLRRQSLLIAVELPLRHCRWRQLVYCVEHRNWPSLERLQGVVSEVKTCARGSAILGLRPSPEGSYLHRIEAIFGITD
ncbi:unnamed protein product, partial [Cuscuta campestris]